MQSIIAVPVPKKLDRLTTKINFTYKKNGPAFWSDWIGYLHFFTLGFSGQASCNLRPEHWNTWKHGAQRILYFILRKKRSVSFEDGHHASAF